MSVESVRNWLINHPTFQRLVDNVILSGVRDEFPSINGPQTEIENNWQHLLLCASVLARSDIPEEQRIALRIADTCLKLGATTPDEKAASAVILDTMANKRSVELAAKRGLISDDFEASLPIPLRADFLKRSSEDQIQSSDQVQHPANRFQVAFWNALSKGQFVSASAPTSAGKSFLLRLWVSEVFRNNHKALVAFIVPSRALIQEFSDAFGEDIATGKLKGVMLHSLPLEESFPEDHGHLFIFTQERLHILLGRRADIAFDLIIVDEAQKIGEGCRGVLLEQVIAECSNRSTTTQVVYASPFVDNPAYLIGGIPAGSNSLSIDREVTTVTQNLLFASQKRGDPTTWNVSFVADKNEIPIGTIALLFRPTTEAKRLSAVAFTMQSPTGGNLIYANSPSRAEAIAQQISDGYQSQGVPSLETHPRIAELIKLVQKIVHKKYLLTETLKHGVAYHYGNMPLLIRSEIESLFRENILRFLICTATLIEGVNLPCKIIFMRGPTKGKGNPMQPVDFWNLAGRAGRWGTEFHGSIVCIDPTKPTVWKEPPPRKRMRQHIKAATELILEEGAAIMQYVESGYPRETSLAHTEFDYTLTFLFHSFLRDGSLNKVRSATTLPAPLRERLQEVFCEELEVFPLPKELIFRHPGILPHSLSELLAELRTLSAEDLELLAPVLPESDDAAERYAHIFKFIDSHLRANWSSPGDNEGKRLFALAITAVDWMKGKPLSVLIRKREKFNTRRARPDKLSAVIIATMSDIEEYARFKIPKFLRAFLDVLNFHAQQAGLAKGICELPNLELWLELGVSVRTQLSLMELGMSRTSAIEIFDLMMDDNLSKAEALSWLREANVTVLENLPQLVKNEITRVISRSTPPT